MAALGRKLPERVRPGSIYLQYMPVMSPKMLNLRFALASSTDRRNTLVKLFCRGLETQRLARTLVQLARHSIQLRLRVYRQVGPFGKILSQQTVGVLVGTPLKHQQAREANHAGTEGAQRRVGCMQLLAALAYFENKPSPSTKSNHRGEAPQ